MKTIKYWLEFIWFYTMCILSIPLTPFVFVWAVYMIATEDYYQYRNHKKELEKLQQLKGE